MFCIDGDNVVRNIKFVLSAPPHSPLVADSTPQHSPPVEGCLKDGVVNKEILTTINNHPIYRNFVKNLPYNPKLKPLLKDKRKAGILSEVLFWQQVHKGKFHNIDFDRQRIIGNYIVDFYVKALGLVVEIDGSSHDNKKDYDAQRQLFLENLGLKVYRITDSDMKRNAEVSMLGLEKYIIEQYSIGGVDKPPLLSGTPPLEGNFSQDVIKGRVYINDTQYFDNVPEVAWNFYIDGYQPAQKWLKERKDKKLDFEDILHYQKFIVALTKTGKLMKGIDTIQFE